jgi:hypothetical protein
LIRCVNYEFSPHFPLRALPLTSDLLAQNLGECMSIARFFVMGIFVKFCGQISARVPLFDLTE